MHIDRKQEIWKGHRMSWYEAGQGPALMLLHGGGGTGKDFWAQIEHLSDRYRVVAPDLPGFGRSDWIDGVDRVEQIAPVLLQWLPVIGIERMVLGGNSMGGRVALAAASLAPGHLAGLILLDAVGVSLPGVPILNPLELPSQQFLENLVHHPESYREVTPYRRLEDIGELTQGRKAFARYLSHGPIAPVPEQDLTHIAMPVLLIWGQHDRIVPLAYGQALAERLDNARLVVIDDVGHLPHIEASDIVTRHIRQFMEALQHVL